MKGVSFGTYHSYADFSLILTSKEIAAPKTKTVKIDVEGADGSIDLTDFFGEPKYEDCTHKFQFSTIVPQSEFLTLFSTIKNAIHGKKLRIVLDDDPLFYYVGRCFVSSFTSEKTLGKLPWSVIVSRGSTRQQKPLSHKLSAAKALFPCPISASVLSRKW